jgi:hypothetical protein
VEPPRGADAGDDPRRSGPSGTAGSTARSSSSAASTTRTP